MENVGDWQMNCTEMKQRGGYLLHSGQWSDCTFLVGTEPHQVQVKGHKLLLAMASPVFEAMFYGGMAEGNGPIPILDVQPEAFKALLEYIYTDNINISSFDKACELCYGAKKYMMPHLVKECTKYLWSDLHPRNACRAYEFAKLFEEPGLMDKCMQIICTNTKEVITDSSWEEVELPTVIAVLSLDYLNVDSELDLFHACARYQRAQHKKQERSLSPVSDSTATGLESPAPSTSKVVVVESSAENSPEVIDPCSNSNPAADTQPPAATGAANIASAANITSVANITSTAAGDGKKATGEAQAKEKVTVRSAVEKIRFLTLTPQQFAEGPARSSLLTESESFAVLMNILSSSSDVPMPRGFSVCRVPRKHLMGGPSSNIVTFTVDTPSPVLMEVNSAKSGGSRSSQAPIFVPVPHQPTPAVDLFDRHVDRVDRHADQLPNKLYCHRPLIQQTDCLNTNQLDCSVTFMVDKNICLLGVQVPTQVPGEELSMRNYCGGSMMYSELLYASLLDAEGSRLTYTHYTSRVPYRHLLDIMFNRPVYIQRNKVYKVSIVFNKVGWYPMGTCAHQVATESVFFNFAVGQTSDSVRDGLIRSIIFTY